MTQIKPPQPVTSAGQGPQLAASHTSSDRARLLLRVALSGVQLPFEVFDSALSRATAVIERYRLLDEEARASAVPFDPPANDAPPKKRANGKS